MKSRSGLSALILSLFLAVSLSGCMAGGGGHGGGGGGGNDVINLNIQTTGVSPSTFVIGTNASFGVEVSDVGKKPSDQPVTATVALPTGLTYVAYTSTTPGWTCSATGQTITCTSTDSIAGLTGTSSFTLNVGVASNGTAGTVSMPLSVETPDGTPATNTFNANITINNPAPTITSLSPSSLPAYSTNTTLTVNGTNFVNGSAVMWNSTACATQFVSTTQLTATFPVSLQTPGTIGITVVNHAPGGGTSNAATFTINQPVPTLTSISPTSATVDGPAFTLTANGTNFTALSQVQWNGSSRATTFLNNVQLTAQILASDLVTTAASATITVSNPTPGGGTTAGITFTINATNPVPVIGSLSPASANAGGPAFTLTVYGSGLVLGSQVQWNGSNRQTDWSQATSGYITAQITAADVASAGTAQVTVVNPTPGGGTSNVATFTINASNPAPVISSISPTSATAGGPGFTLYITGTGFVQASQVQWGSTALQTSYSSSTSISAAVPASDIATAGSVSITVLNPPPGGTSNALPFTIATAPPTITTTSPLAGATLSSWYTASVTASGGVPPYTWALASPSPGSPPNQTLPAGLSLTSASPSATISGTPTETGTYEFGLVVTDSTSATGSATFLLTVTGSSSFTCPSPVNLTLCGNYIVEGEGMVTANSGGFGPRAFGGTFLADNAGHIVSGVMKSNDPNAGYTTGTITGGSYSMDTSGDGLGTLMLTDSNANATVVQFTLHSNANAAPGPLVSTWGTGSGIVWGPFALPVPQIAANTVLALKLDGANGTAQRVGLLGNFQVGSNGCDGSSGSFNVQAGEPIFTNSGGTVNTALTSTGSCTAPDANGFGTAQITLSGGTPFTSNTLNFDYLEVVVSGVVEGVLFMSKDSFGANQPILGGMGTPVSNPGTYTATSLGGCPCLLVAGGAPTGQTLAYEKAASIARVLTTPGAGNSGTLSGFNDENNAGSVSSGVWGYSNYTIDSNGVGTITGTGQPTIHFVIGGDTTYVLDESSLVLSGEMRQQNSTSIESPGVAYVLQPKLLGFGGGDSQAEGVLIPSGATSGTFGGSVFSLDGIHQNPTQASGSYTSIDPTTGRGTGSEDFFYSEGSDLQQPYSFVIYAFRHREFVILDTQSYNPFLWSVQLQ